jgi:hypothetical protein
MFAADAGRGARGWCRHSGCGYFAWADNDREDGYGKPLTPKELAQMAEERARLEKRERLRVQKKLKHLQQRLMWREWHESMTRAQRQLWIDQGIPRAYQDHYKLGFCPNHAFYHNGEKHHSPTMTIPFWEAEHRLTNVQHRLLEPIDPGDKYRQTGGIPQSMFWTDPDTGRDGTVIVAEGAKKALVVHRYIGDRGYDIAAIPSKTPGRKLIDQLDDYGLIYLMLDPDAYEPQTARDGRVIRPAIDRIVGILGQARVRLVKIPDKPDDFLLAGNSSALMLAYINVAEKPLLTPTVSGIQLGEEQYKLNRAKARRLYRLGP